METTMNMHFNPEPPPLSGDAYRQARSRRARAFGRSKRRGIGRIADTMRRVWRMFGIWLVRRHVTRELQMLPDHMLADIGVRRGEIPGIARRVALHGIIRRKGSGHPNSASRAPAQVQ
jgi:uncharacterized protein YjiS (DUF1127 family)